MASIDKISFSIYGLIIHSSLNIPIQKSLFSLPNLSSNSSNQLTCWYEQLQFVVMDEILLVGAKMFNVIIIN
jgi:hypothetical protein